MSEKESSIVDAAEGQSTENEAQESTGFDINAFLSEEEGKVDTNTDDQPYTEVDNSKSGDDEDIDGFAWSDIESPTNEEEESEEEQEEEEDWDEVVFRKKESTEAESDKEDEVSKEPGEIDWKAVSESLGLKIDSNYKEQLEAIVRKMDAQGVDPIKSAKENEIIDKMESFLKMSDRDLLSEEMKNDGMEDDDIVSVLDSMEDAGTIKRDAFRIRKQHV